MVAAIAILSLLTGTAKSVSVCGINSASVARPYSGARPWSIAAYALGLGLGALVLVGVVSVAGMAVFGAFPVPARARELIAACALIVVGLLEIVHGAWLFPHVAWAVPRQWAAMLGSMLFLLLFGVIRGLAVFNHSPFASMHVWLLTLFLLPMSLPAVVPAMALAIGLAFWTLVYGLLVVVRPVDHVADFRRITERSLGGTISLGRIDGVAIAVVGLVMLLSAV